MKLIWSSTIESGHALMDKQHKELFEHINKFFDSLNNEISREETIETLNYLVEYVGHHFRTEEELMQEISYPYFKKHQTEHRQIVEQLAACYKLLRSESNSETVIKDTTQMLLVWAEEHIPDSDIKLARYIKIQ